MDWKEEDLPMKKKLLKIAAVVGIVTMAISFAGCKKTECEWCGEMKRCKTVYLTLLGDYNMCKDCRELVAPISENLEQLEGMEFPE